MASPETLALIQSRTAAELKLIAQGFGQKPRNGAEAADYLKALPDDQIAAAFALLPPPANAASAPAEAPAADAAPEAPPAPVLTRISVKKRVEYTYNGHTFVFSPDPRECTPCPSHVADYFAEFFETNGVRFHVL